LTKQSFSLPSYYPILSSQSYEAACNFQFFFAFAVSIVHAFFAFAVSIVHAFA